MSKLMTVIGLFAAALTLASPMAHAALITNGGFDTSSAPTNVMPTPWQCAGPNCAAGAVSVFAPGTADVGGGGPVYPGFPNQSPASGNFLGIDPCFNSGGPVGSPCSPGGHSSVVYQEVNTPGGLLAPGTYVLNFYQAGGQWNTYLGPTTTQWEVGLGSSCLLQCGNSSGFSGIGGEIQFSQAMVNSPGGNGTTGTYVPWELETLSFTVPSSAAATPQFLSFVPIGNIAVPPVVFLDGVSLQAPESGTLLTLGVGLLGLSVVGLRRRARRGLSVVGSPGRDGMAGAF